MRVSTVSIFFKGTEFYASKLDALTQSGFVYMSYSAATTDMGMHVSRYVASCRQNSFSIGNTNVS